MTAMQGICRLIWVRMSPTRSERLRPGGTAWPWSFYIFSACGSANKLLFRDFDLELVQEFRVFGHLLAQQGDEIQAGGPMRLSAPLGQGFISGPALCAESH